MKGNLFPKIIFGTSSLGNLYTEIAEEQKFELVKNCFEESDGLVMFDSAGKYGAGLALEVLGKCLNQLNIQKGEVQISNKLGWLRTELKGKEPTFEPGVWKNLKNDAKQTISYKGVIECFDQGNKLLGGYTPQMVSVHDPDEYLAMAESRDHYLSLYNDILEAYRALYDLKKEGIVSAIGIGAKDWKVIQELSHDVNLDWVMIANSMTIKSHPQALLDLIYDFHLRDVWVINSAVFHSGFLVGSDYFDYKLLDPHDPSTRHLYDWREKFYLICKQYEVTPAEACVQFALQIPGVGSIALNTTDPKRVKQNIAMTEKKISPSFWRELYENGLIQIDFEKNIHVTSMD
ncbi:MAG: aldo/keto reductase [Saprospiraceae bacterium]|nr:aldo/keto reductase [Saprospiraceae bacterium]MBK8632699.1 aldo/keto reductase [Saprospiraceae bacterium]MBP7641788.1 aldo/keto reductase [Saprospiraceae bacterium]